MDNEPKTRKGSNGKKKDPKQKGKSESLYRQKHIRERERLMEKRKEKQKKN